MTHRFEMLSQLMSVDKQWYTENIPNHDGILAAHSYKA